MAYLHTNFTQNGVEYLVRLLDIYSARAADVSEVFYSQSAAQFKSVQITACSEPSGSQTQIPTWLIGESFGPAKGPGYPKMTRNRLATQAGKSTEYVHYRTLI